MYGLFIRQTQTKWGAEVEVTDTGRKKQTEKQKDSPGEQLPLEYIKVWLSLPLF